MVGWFGWLGWLDLMVWLIGPVVVCLDGWIELVGLVCCELHVRVENIWFHHMALKSGMSR